MGAVLLQRCSGRAVDAIQSFGISAHFPRFLFLEHIGSSFRSKHAPNGGGSRATDVGAVKAPNDSEEPIMQAITTIGLDIAKSVFQVHGVDAEGNVVIRRQL